MIEYGEVNIPEPHTSRRVIRGLGEDVEMVLNRGMRSDFDMQRIRTYGLCKCVP